MGFRVNDDVIIVNDKGGKVAEGVVYNVNDFREPSMKYAVDVEGYSDFLFVGERNLKPLETKMERPLYLESLNVLNFRNGEENPRVIGLVHFTPKRYEERLCFKVVYESDGFEDYIPYSEIADGVWRMI